MTLDRLAPDHCAAIAAVLATGMVGERMAALGLRAGRHVAVLRRGPFGGPLHLRIGPTELMIRRADARTVLLERIRPWKPSLRF
jgi:ferrous iron transport protein A